MFHLTDVRWAQIALVQVGIAFQLIALWRFYSEASTHRHGSQHEEDEAHKTQTEQYAETQRFHGASALRRSRRRAESLDDSTIELIRARQIARARKMKFRQNFNFPRHGQ